MHAQPGRDNWKTWKPITPSGNEVLIESTTTEGTNLFQACFNEKESVTIHMEMDVTRKERNCMDSSGSDPPSFPFQEVEDEFFETQLDLESEVAVGMEAGCPQFLCRLKVGEMSLLSWLQQEK